MRNTFWRHKAHKVLSMAAAALMALSASAVSGLAAETGWTRIEEGSATLHGTATETLTASAPAGATLAWEARRDGEEQFAPLEAETSATLELDSAETGLDGSWIRVVATLPNGDTQASVPVPVQRVGHSLRRVRPTDPGCEEEGNKEYWTCTLCGRNFADADARTEATPEELRVASTGHAFEYVPEVSPTEEKDGCRAHWKCAACQRTYKDQPAKEELSKEDLFISRLGHTYVISVTSATCTAAGHTTYACNHCANTYTADEVPALGHDLQEIPGEDPMETRAGLVRHWVCRRCGKLFSDQEGKDEATADQLVRPATGHAYEKRTVDSTCTEPGCTLSTCSACGHMEKSGDTAPLGHDLEHVPAKDPTCQEAGSKAHWRCRRCGQIIGDQDVELPKGDHAYVDTVKDPTCLEGGFTEHVCSVCGDTCRDAETDALGHSLVEVPRVEPTADAPGSIRHFRCERCGALFADEDGSRPLTEEEIVIPRLQGPPANTQDTENAWVWIAVVGGAAIALALILKGRRRNAQDR